MTSKLSILAHLLHWMNDSFDNLASFTLSSPELQSSSILGTVIEKIKHFWFQSVLDVTFTDTISL